MDKSTIKANIQEIVEKDNYIKIFNNYIEKLSSEELKSVEFILKKQIKIERINNIEEDFFNF